MNDSSIRFFASPVLLFLIIIGCRRTFIDEDKKELIRLTLETAILQEEITAYNLLKDTSTFILSTENVKPDWVPNFPHKRIILMSRDAIQAKANRDGDFLYLQFEPFVMQNDGGVVARLNNDWCLGKHSGQRAGGGGIALTYYKNASIWKEGAPRKLWTW